MLEAFGGGGVMARVDIEIGLEKVSARGKHVMGR